MILRAICYKEGFPGGSDGKESACNAGDLGSIPPSERSPGEGSGNPVQYSCLENSWTEEPGGLQRTEDPWWGHKESDTTERPTLSLLSLAIKRKGC